MIGYLVIFIAAVVAFTLVIQGTYKKAPLFANYPVIDEILGGLLGIVQGFLLLLFVVIILDQYYLYTNIPAGSRRDRVPAHVLGRDQRRRTSGRSSTPAVIPAFISIFGLSRARRRMQVVVRPAPAACSTRSRAGCSPPTPSTRRAR